MAPAMAPSLRLSPLRLRPSRLPLGVGRAAVRGTGLDVLGLLHAPAVVVTHPARQFGQATDRYRGDTGRFFPNTRSRRSGLPVTPRDGAPLPLAARSPRNENLAAAARPQPDAAAVACTLWGDGSGAAPDYLLLFPVQCCCQALAQGLLLHLEEALLLRAADRALVGGLTRGRVATDIADENRLCREVLAALE